MAAKGYPGAVEKGSEIHGHRQRPKRSTDVLVFHAGTKQDGDRILANGGRVLNVTAHRAHDHARLKARAYEAVERSIGRKASAAGTSAGAPWSASDLEAAKNERTELHYFRCTLFFPNRAPQL